MTSFAAITLFASTGHAAESVAGCYSIATFPQTDFFPHPALVLIDRATSDHEWYLSDAKAIGYYEEHHLRPLTGYWRQDGDNVLVMLSANGADGYVARVKRNEAGYEGKVRTLRTKRPPLDNEPRLNRTIPTESEDPSPHITLTPAHCRIS